MRRAQSATCTATWAKRWRAACTWPHPLTHSHLDAQHATPVGDLHGDMGKALASLRLARVLGADAEGKPCWAGGNAVVVQLGDVLDRGNVEIGEQLAVISRARAC